MRDTCSARARAVLLALIALAGVLRFATLGTQSFSGDEQYTAWLVRLPLGDLLSNVPNTERTPYTYYVILHGWGRLFGTGEVALRSLSALCGTLTVPVVYATLARFASRRVALAAAALVAVNPFLIWWSQEARAYAPLILLAVVGARQWALALERPAWRSLMWWAVASAAAIAIHLFAIFLVIPEAVVLAARLARAQRRAFYGSLLPIAATSGLLLPLALRQRHVSAPVNGTLVERIVAIPKNFAVGYYLPAEVLLSVLAAVFIGVGLWFLLRARPSRDRRVGWIAAGLGASAIVLPVAIAPFGLDYVESRHQLIALIPCMVAVAAGLVVAPRRLGIAALAGLMSVSLVCVLGVDIDPVYQRADFRGAAQALGRPKQPRVVLFSPQFSDRGPMGVYEGPLGGLPLAGWHTREIAVVALASYGGFGPGAATTAHTPPAAAPAGFRLTETRYTKSYTLFRYRATRQRLVTCLTVAPLAIPHYPPTLVVQEPRSGRALAAAFGPRPWNVPECLTAQARTPTRSAARQ